MRGLMGARSGVGDLQLAGDVTSKVGIHRIGVTHEGLEHGSSRRVGEIEGDGSLVSVERLEEQRVVVASVRRYRTADIAVLGRVLDLDDVGAEVSEVQGTKRAGTVLLDGQNP